MPARLLELKDDRRRGKVRAMTSVSSAHPLVLRAAMEQALADQAPLLVEATCNQVNQDGGYTGMTPEAFAGSIQGLAAEAGLPASRIILGGAHLGPGPWRETGPEEALDRAGEMVAAYVSAGFRKIHLDTSMPCAGDPPVLDVPVVARRAAELVLLAERAFAADPAGHPPVYVVGTEVSSAGGARSTGPRVRLTTPEDLARSLDDLQEAFAAAGAGPAWERVAALVVQPGVDFGETDVHPYDRRRARALSEAIQARAPWMGEAHSTDYQSPRALRELVEDGFGILGVGPWLTFACREALFALEDVAREMDWLHGGGAGIRLREVLDGVMRRNPAHWKDHHRGSPGEQSYARLFSLSDRSRYYWHDPEVEAEVERLLAATEGPLPIQLLSLHLPMAFDDVMDGRLEPNGRAIVLHAIRRVLGHYTAACS